jgi:hypothetical protein
MRLLTNLQSVGTYVTWSRGLISHPYDDSSAAYLGTAILTILYGRYSKNTNKDYEPYTVHSTTPGDANTKSISKIMH